MGNFYYYKVQVADGLRMMEDAIVQTCQGAGLKAVCPGGSECNHNSPDCFVTPIMPSKGCNYLEGPSEEICGYPPKQCTAIDFMFIYMKSWGGGTGLGALGVVRDAYPAQGKNYISEHDKQSYYAFCVQCGECKGKLWNNLKNTQIF